MSGNTEKPMKAGPNAFITTKKGFCYLTIKRYGQNRQIMRIRKYKIEPEEKRDMRRLHPDVIFDWKKITAQLAEKREVCRDYRSRRRSPATARDRAGFEPFWVAFDPTSRTVYADMPPSVRGMGALLDAVLDLERQSKGRVIEGSPAHHKPMVDDDEN